MISHRTHTKDWIIQIREQIPKSDPILINFDFSNWKIENPNFNKLNKLKKTNLEAFYYFCKSLELTQPDFKPFGFSL